MSWLLTPKHFHRRFPTHQEMQFLKVETGMTDLQIRTWFTLARHRVWKPFVQQFLRTCKINMDTIIGSCRVKWEVPTVHFMAEKDKATTSDGSIYNPEDKNLFLKAWMLSPKHFFHPYPNEAERSMLARLSMQSTHDVRRWFAQARKAFWKPLM
ncbi:unnamed protein product, partial [Heterosigma akashiwo]